MNGIGALTKGISDCSPALFPLCEAKTRSWLPVTQKRTSPEPDNAGRLISGFQPPELGGTNFWCLEVTQSAVICDSSPN